MGRGAGEVVFQALFALLHFAAILHATAVAYHLRKMRRAVHDGGDFDG